MTERNLRILQLNMMKSRAGLEALMNDAQTRFLDMLLIQEPPVSSFGTFVHHNQWRLYKPPPPPDGKAIRSLIYVNRRISTSSYTQITCQDPDLVAVQLKADDRSMVIMSIYIQPVELFSGPEAQSIKPTLDTIDGIIARASTHSPGPLEIIAAGDFNRHHPSWSKNRLTCRVLEHAEELVTFIHAHGLHHGLPHGTPTYWSLSRPGTSSSIDLMLTDAPERIIRCRIYNDNYGSDHRGTYCEWDLSPRRTAVDRPRRNYDRTDWKKVVEAVKAAADRAPRILCRYSLDSAVTDLIRTTSEAVEAYTPRAKPTPYSKRWFTPELKQQQRETNRARRSWQQSCARYGKAHAVTLELLLDMKRRRRAWTRAIEKAKASHWKDFLDQATGDTTLWKAATYGKARDAYSNIPPLIVGEAEHTTNQDKARVLMDSFFPPTAPPETTASTQPKLELTWQPITETEIQRCLGAAKGKKAPGPDGLPMLVWKKVWPGISHFVCQLFNSSVDLAHYPRDWKAATIVVLRKPGRPDYSTPAAYRPISLLNTLGKLLEAVMARRLSYWAEKHDLLPNAQFGGRPGRTTEQALLVLANAIDRAWLKMKVVTLIAFDLKNAFNGVKTEVLDARLKSKGIPAQVRRWIRSFMTDRRASIRFDDFETSLAPLSNAGLPQGSPLSPILFIFFNADLVDQPVDFSGGSSAFIDDYFRWRAGKSVADNVRKIQDEDIPRIEEWARKTGSQFAAEKTELIHLTRRKGVGTYGQVEFDGATVEARDTVKLLGVVFDREMRWKEHVQQVVKRAARAVSATSGLRHLRPMQMRQLYQACVTPVVDYASTVWHDPLKDKMHLRALATIQREALIRILSAFKTVATQTMEVEAYLPPTRLRLKQRAQQVVLDLYTLPKGHPAREILDRAERRVAAKGTTPRCNLMQTLKTMDISKLRMLETIDRKPLKPWRVSDFQQISFARDKEDAERRLSEGARRPSTFVFTDASSRQSKVGAAAVMLDEHGQRRSGWQGSVGSSEEWTVHAAELIAIRGALDLVLGQVMTTGSSDEEGQAESRTYTIVSDSKSALQSLREPRRGSGQEIVEAIAHMVKSLGTCGARIALLWVPSHCGIQGNEEADRMAKEAVGTYESHGFGKSVRTQRAAYRRSMLEEWREEWSSSPKGRSLKRIDSSLPSRRSLRVWGRLTRTEAYTLSQLRTEHAWLSSYAKRYNFSEDNRCECGAVETVAHVLMDCPLLRELRKDLRQKAGSNFRSVSLMLGGTPDGRQQGQERCQIMNRQWPVNKPLLEAVIHFAVQSGRFSSRASARPGRARMS